MTIKMGHLEGLWILSTNTNGVVPSKTVQISFIIAIKDHIKQQAFYKSFVCCWWMAI
jgi:hypothetical protein